MSEVVAVVEASLSSSPFNDRLLTTSNFSVLAPS
jgi:hypothetical protein